MGRSVRFRTNLSDFYTKMHFIAVPRGGAPQYAAILLPDEAVALARGFLQACPIEDGDAAVPVIDGPNSLQGARCDGDTGTAHGKHHREKFLGERQRIGLGA